MIGVAVIVSVGLLGAGLAGFFADPLHLPDEVLDVLDKRASVISMFTGLAGLLVAGAALLMQIRSSSSSSGAQAPPADDDASGLSPGGGLVDLSGGVVHGPVTATAVARTEAGGMGAVAVGGDTSGVIVTGAHASITMTTAPAAAAAGPVLPPVAQVPANDLTALPRRASRVFVGREDQLRQLVGVLEAGPGVIAQAVVGLGGIGKTELALHHATVRRHDYDLIWWIDAETPGAIQTGLAALCRALCAGVASAAAAQVPVAEAEAWTLAWLSTHPRWLLVFDNTDDPADVQPYLGRLHRGHVLITSRRSADWTDVGTVVRLGVLEHDQAVELLHELIGEAVAWNQVLAEELAAELDGLPLALRHAGAYIAATPGVDLARYLRLLRTTPAMGSGRPGALQEVVGRSLALTVARIGQIYPLAVEVLSLLACYAPEQLPCPVLYGMDDAGGADEAAVAEALRVLASYSLIGRSAGGDAVIVHRLVQAATLATLLGAEREALRCRAVELLEVALPDDPEAPVSWPVYARLLPHARAVLEPGSAAMEKVIDYLGAAGDWRTARTLQHQRLTVLRNRVGFDHPDTLAVRHNLAHWTGRTGDAVAAREMFAQLLPVRERVQGVEHPDTLITRHEFASWTGLAGDAVAAREMFAQLLLVCERVQGVEHPDTLSVRHQLASWTGWAGDAVAAREMFVQLAPVRERVLGSEYPNVLITRYCLARWTGRAGDAVEARQMLTRLVPMMGRVLGAEHPYTLTARQEFAWWMGQAGDAVAAREMFAQLLSVQERVLGVEHPDTLTTRSNLAYWAKKAQKQP
ncbi:tetratricopeptide repeat protein [Streptosporangium sp. NPDC051022]|uniref:tetratricopeptide repeat protein n=1 Tax=Streptosporangium sp. NPDC051022 TaxID=3155752 RepID=UPI00344A36F5